MARPKKNAAADTEAALHQAPEQEDSVFRVTTDRRPAWGGKRLEKGAAFRAPRSAPGLEIMLRNGFIAEE